MDRAVNSVLTEKQTTTVRTPTWYCTDVADGLLCWCVFLLVLGAVWVLGSGPVAHRFHDSPPLWAIPFILAHAIGILTVGVALAAIVLHGCLSALAAAIRSTPKSPAVEPKWLASARIRCRLRGKISFWAALTLLLFWQILIGSPRKAVDQAGALLGWAGNVTLMFWLITLAFRFMYRRRLNIWRPDL